MLYVFHVDAGKMLTFDMCTAMDSVNNLKEQIHLQYGIPAVNQVLLVSGGEMLLPANRVCSYSAGTDTNPIFMFSTIVDPSNQPQPWPSIEQPDTVLEMKEKVEQCRSLAANYQTVVRRNQLAQQFDELARAELSTCERLVHEQHLQQQGWSAVVANMEDLTVDFSQRCSFFEGVFSEMFKKRDHYLQCLVNFNEDLGKLANIPILPALTQNAAKPFNAFDDALGDNNSFSKPTKSNESSASSGTRKPHFTVGDDEEVKPAESGGAENEQAATLEDNQVLTLLEWISRDEKQTSLRKMAEQCQNAMQKVSESDIEKMRSDAQNVIKTAEQKDVKQIKGLEGRLSGLEDLMQEARNTVKDQNELAMGFQQNQTRANLLADASILPDLCISHEKQMNVMFANHKKLGSIKVRIFNSKCELGNNLLQRLKYVICIENKMNDLNDTLLFNHRNCLRLQRHMNIIEQIHMAPTIYATAVSEVVRRRHFSSAFLMWASELASQLLTIYNDECTKRHEFSALFDGHFLINLFPGMEDMPPKYAIEAPSLFDSSLPALTKADLQEFSAKVPDDVTKIEVPDLSAVIEFFQLRSGSQKFGERPSGGGTNKLLDMHSHLKEYEKGFDSETDTEEYEKVGQSPIDKRKGSEGKAAAKQVTISTQTTEDSTTDTSTSMEGVETQNSETLTEENLSTDAQEVERLKKLLSEMYQLSSQSIDVLKRQVIDLKSDSKDHRLLFGKEFEKLNDIWMKLKLESEHQTQQLIKQTMDHEIEMNDLKQNLNAKCQHIQELISEQDRVKKEQIMDRERFETDLKTKEESMSKLNGQIDKLESRLAEALAEREKIIQDEKEKLNRDYNYKLESLRSRYKLMTSMEQSPSETSLEKIERHDVFDISGQEGSTLTQSMVRGGPGMPIIGSIGSYRLEGSLPTLVSGSPRSPSSRSQDFFKRIMEEKENQLDTLRSHIDQLTRENERYKQTITDLTDNLNKDSTLVTQLVAADRERKRLEAELENEKQKRTVMEESVAAIPKIDTSQTDVLKRDFYVNLSSCSVGSYVVAVWNSVHNHFIIVQDSPILYFLHNGSSYDALKLSPMASDSETKITSCVGKVVHKEYCVARKDDNRYKVPKGTKFYRVIISARSGTGKDAKAKGGLSRSASSSEKSDLVHGGTPRTTSTGNLTSSFAQTEIPLNAVVEETAKDMIDSGMQASGVVYKDRNISLTEEDEPPVMAISSGDDSTGPDHKQRYSSVSEGDDVMMDAVGGQEEVVLDDENLYYPERKIRHVDYHRQRSGSDENESDEEFRSLEMKEQEIS